MGEGLKALKYNRSLVSAALIAGTLATASSPRNADAQHSQQPFSPHSSSRPSIRQPHRSRISEVEAYIGRTVEVCSRDPSRCPEPRTFIPSVLELLAEVRDPAMTRDLTTFWIMPVLFDHNSDILHPLDIGSILGTPHINALLWQIAESNPNTQNRLFALHLLSFSYPQSAEPSSSEQLERMRDLAIQIVDQNDSRFRLQALGLLTEFFGSDSRVQDVLTSLRASGSADVRLFVALHLMDHRPLLEMVRDRNPIVRLAAVRSLYSHDASYDSSTLETLCPQILATCSTLIVARNDRSSEVRLEIRRALAAFETLYRRCIMQEGTQ